MKRFSRFTHLLLLAAFVALFAGESFHAHAQPVDNTACGVCQTLHHTPLLNPPTSAAATAPLWTENLLRDASPCPRATVAGGAQAIRGPPTH